MKLSVKLFAMLQEQLGDVVTVNVPEKPTADQIKQAVSASSPNLQQLVSTSRLAVNQEFTTSGSLDVSPSDEVALIPPVSGG